MSPGQSQHPRNITHTEEDSDDEMWDWDIRPKPSEGPSAEPLLSEEASGDRERGRSSYEGVEVDERARERRRHEMRSRSPTSASARAENRKKYVMAAIFLVLSLVSFVVQTETAQYIQLELGWQKAYAMLYLTHGSWVVLWPTQLLILKMRKPNTPWGAFLTGHLSHIKTTAQMIMASSTRLSHSQVRADPTYYMLKRIIFITCALTFAGSTCAFFAYAFSIPMLHEKPRALKIGSVAIAIVGVLVVAYGDGNSVDENETQGEKNRVLGNIIIGIGSVLYGFYEVLYKKVACPPEGTSSGRSAIFANTVGSGIGAFTLCVLWIPIPILHWTGIETFEIPSGEAAIMLAISVFSNAVFSGSFLILMSLTSPVLSSVAGLLTIFLVAITDWFIFGTPISTAALLGGVLIIAAFVLLSWCTWEEMNEEKPKVEDDITDEDD
ncbi:uncharacterized protein H6S33_000884 [Morchella sextelata]|uniref:uncharacterized protein n=1 Tax=Morchella sextelata TaxID=1174677 RepID=UPI001D05BE31|nr:uncharacterized protein H6S33_000884 [Morchella sextelata]KAH0615248.1 hypothetical protein H6S33_000884 [Morchella sextelata]